MVYDPKVKSVNPNNTAGYSWAIDGLFLGYKAKRPLEVGVNFAGEPRLGYERFAIAEIIHPTSRPRHKVGNSQKLKPA